MKRPVWTGEVPVQPCPLRPFCDQTLNWICLNASPHTHESRGHFPVVQETFRTSSQLAHFAIALTFERALPAARGPGARARGRGPGRPAPGRRPRADRARPRRRAVHVHVGGREQKLKSQAYPHRRQLWQGAPRRPRARYRYHRPPEGSPHCDTPTPPTRRRTPSGTVPRTRNIARRRR